ncbi:MULTISPECIES: hypothetical protein [unclassified Nonomuraea]
MIAGLSTQAAAPVAAILNTVPMATILDAVPMATVVHAIAAVPGGPSS